MRRLLTTAATLAAVGALCLGCGDDEDGGTEFSAELEPVSEAEDGFSYDEALAPSGAKLTVTVDESDDETTIVLEAEGLVKDRGYAVHAHTKPCGGEGEDAGAHFQNEVDPAATPDKPSTDPTFANPDNEIWLDFRTDGDGNGQAGTTVPFGFDDRKPASIVVHAETETATASGKAGSAGGRIACLNLPLG